MSFKKTAIRIVREDPFRPNDEFDVRKFTLGFGSFQAKKARLNEIITGIQVDPMQVLKCKKAVRNIKLRKAVKHSAFDNSDLGTSPQKTFIEREK